MEPACSWVLKSPTHLGGLGEPVPSRLATAAELVRLAGALRAGRAGMVALTPSSYLRGLTPEDRALLRDLDDPERPRPEFEESDA